MKADSRPLAMVVLLVGVVAAVSACGTNEKAEWEAADTIPFMVCGSSETWTRPSEEEQAREVWSDPRYAERDPAQLREFLYEDFFPWHGGGSEAFDLGHLHGLWSIEDSSLPDPQCDAGPGLSRGEFISLFLLLHEAKEVRLSGNTYWVVVEETPSGFQEIQFANVLFPEHPTEEYPILDYSVVIVDVEGRELARSEDGGLFQTRGEDGVQTTTPTPERAGASEAYKDVAEVVDVLHDAGIASKVVRLRPIGVVKG